MSDPKPAQSTDSGSQEANHSALFANLVLQQANMAMMLMGKMPSPEGGEGIKDLEAARLFIDQLEMLEVKTKGNLLKEESGLLKQTLMSLRLAFVEAVEKPGAPGPKAEEKAPEQKAPGGTAEGATPQAGSAEDEQRKKFSKKY